MPNEKKDMREHGGESGGVAPLYECKVMTLAEMMELDVYEPRHSYKRGFVWSKEQKRAFIVNCIEGHFPGYAFMARDPHGKWILLDFPQRFVALREYSADPRSLFRDKDSIVNVTLGALDALGCDIGENELRDGIDKMLAAYGGDKDEETLRESAHRLLGTGGETADKRLAEQANKLAKRLASYREEAPSLQDMRIPVIQFDSVNDAVFDYVRMYMNRQNVQEQDIWRARWNTCEIDIGRCKCRGELLECLRKYYDDLSKKAGYADQSWEEKRAKAADISDPHSASLYERILNAEAEMNRRSPARNFEKMSDVGMSGDGGSCIITLYELCCALAYVFYERAPRFDIREYEDLDVSDWKASYLGYIFLSDIFDGILYGDNPVETMASLSEELSCAEVMDALVESVKGTCERFMKIYDESIFSQRSGPSRYTFTPFMEMSFYLLWHARYKMVRNGEGGLVSGIEERDDPDVDEKMSHILPVLLFRMIVQEFSGIGEPYSMQWLLGYGHDTDAVARSLAEWDDVGRSIERILATRNTDMASWLKYNNQDHWIIYSMFAMACEQDWAGREGRNRDAETSYVKSSIFELDVVANAFEHNGKEKMPGEEARRDNVELGNMFFMPGDTRRPIKENIGLRDQLERLEGAYDNAILDELDYPKRDGSPDKPMTFKYIRANLQKGRTGAYEAFMEKRERDIWAVVEKRMHQKIMLAC